MTNTNFNPPLVKSKTIKKFKPGRCSRCSSTDIKKVNGIVLCQSCNDWQWFESAIDSCWNGYVK